MNWFEANDHCKTEGGKLVEIETEEENTALVEEMQRRGFKDKNFWMGLTDRKSEGDWIFESSGKNPSYKNWNTMEANNRWFQMGDLEFDCALIRNSGIWAEFSCDMKNNGLFVEATISFHALCEFQESGDSMGTKNLIAVAETPFICFRSMINKTFFRGSTNNKNTKGPKSNIENLTLEI